MTKLCQVVFTGTLDGDADIENAVEQFSNLLDYSIDESRSLLTAGREVVIKQGVDPDRAEYCQRALTQVGVGVRIESADSETTDSPFTESANDTGNPYQVSSASFYEAKEQGELTDPHSVPVLRGWFWIQEGFGYIRRRGAWSWLLAAMIYLSVIFGGSFVPLIGPYAVILILPVLNAGFMLGCREQDEGGRFSVKHLLGGFQKPRNQLLLVGGVYIVGVVVSAGVEMALWTLFLLEIDLEAAEMPV
ncbi:MAG: hypothetical protein MI754_07940 [Chromatiales bacterium]|nr:hypothetical protein [Chromatiales bacterium]